MPLRAAEGPLFGVLRPYRDRTGTSASGRLDPFAAPSANVSYLRPADGQCRRLADVPEAGRAHRRPQAERYNFKIE